MTRPARWWARSLSALAGAALALAPAPALAHGDEAPGGSDYTVTVTTPQPLPGVRVQVIDAGTRLMLTNDSAQTVTVLGDSGEPYLRIRPDGAYENTRSPATHRNVTLLSAAAPASADPTAAPQWRRVNRDPVARWHDPRAQWAADQPPAVVAADPARVHRVREWAIPVTVEAVPGGPAAAAITGVLDWSPPPAASEGWLGILVGIALVSLLGVLAAPGTTAATGPVGRVVLLTMSALAVVGGGLAIAYAVARVLDTGATGVGQVLIGIGIGQVWPVLTGLGAIAAGAYAALGRPTGDFALALAGACLGLFPGLTNAAVLGRAVPPVVWDGPAARLVVSAVAAIGLGLAVAGVLRLRAAIALTR
ncbi:hypothetical protein [Pilimelia columellifera]|uniref:Uncharacterized protein n=1 Tax=Pilimelia columellifera subsp. columellifera TaxID=706583 RepID=A0ABN3NIP9_9ACTN